MWHNNQNPHLCQSAVLNINIEYRLKLYIWLDRLQNIRLGIDNTAGLVSA